MIREDLAAVILRANVLPPGLVVLRNLALYSIGAVSTHVFFINYVITFDCDFSASPSFELSRRNHRLLYFILCFFTCDFCIILSFNRHDVLLISYLSLLLYL